MKYKINVNYDIFTLKAPLITAIIQKCVETTLDAEGITAPCEINVLVTNDKGIHAVNLASRQIDRPTDVLSFPMFELEPGNLLQSLGIFQKKTAGISLLLSIATCCSMIMALCAESLRIFLFNHSTNASDLYITPLEPSLNVYQYLCFTLLSYSHFRKRLRR